MNNIIINKKNILVTVVILLGVVLGGIIGAFFAVSSDLPQISSLSNYKPPEITRIYSEDNILLAELFNEKREFIKLKNIPFYLKKAILVIEDKNFYQHSGIDLKGIVRAVVKDIVAGGFVEGASTITQQLTKTLFLTSKKNIMRKIKEALLAFQLERRYTKKEILELYLNQVYFGSGAYGVQAASKRFFGKTVNELTLAQCALIAGMPKAPSYLSPLVNKKRAIKRRNLVLKQMLLSGIIKMSDYKSAVNEPINLSKKNRHKIKAPYFIEYIKPKLIKILGVSNLYNNGYKIFTTLSYKYQEVAEKAVLNGLKNLEKRMKRQKLNYTDKLQSSLVAIDVYTGGILSMVGGKNFDKSPFNRATSAKRQPGSAFKPIIYACAIEKNFTQNHMLLDAPVVYERAKKGEDWQPKNYSKDYKGEITLRKSLALSKNIPSVRLVEKLKPRSVVAFAHKLGIKSKLKSNLSLSLGTSETNLLELTSAYAVFANHGERIKPFGITKILDRTGDVVWKKKTEKAIVMSREGAAITVNMLEAVVSEGTGRQARVINRPIGGKTGTTNLCKDALFLGFSPSIATGVWVGIDNFKTLGKSETGARAALPIWIDYMKNVLKNRPYHYFDLPDKILQIQMNPETGQLANENSKIAVRALFKKGTAPKKISK